MLCYFLMHPMVPEKKSPVIWIDSSLCIMCQYWLVILKMFLKECLLVFRSLIMEYFGMNFFGFFLFRIILDSGGCGFMVLPNFENFQPLFLWLFSCSPLLLGLQWCKCWNFCCCPRSLRATSSSSSSFFIFFLFFRLGEFYWYVPQVHQFYLLSSPLYLLAHSVGCFIFYCIF